MACLENCQFPLLGERKSAPIKSTKTVELHCTCRMPEEKGDEMAECDSCHVWYHRHCMDIPCLEKQRFLGNVRLAVTVIASKYIYIYIYIYMYMYSVYIKVWYNCVDMCCRIEQHIYMYSSLPLEQCFQACVRLSLDYRCML